MQTGIGTHTDEETLEQYAMGTLPEARLAPLEEHLLVCSQCRERLEEADQFVAAMKRVAPRLRNVEKTAGHRFWSNLFPLSLTPRLAYAGAFAAIALVILAGRVWQPGGSPQPALVMLSASRGADFSVSVNGPAGRPLALETEVSELASFDRYVLEVVTAGGDRLYEGQAAPRDGKVRLITTRTFDAGQYFVRLYSPSRKLLREFGLTVR